MVLAASTGEEHQRRGLRPNLDRLVTSVADHGSGIDDMEQAMMFEKSIADATSERQFRLRVWASRLQR